MGCYQVDIPPIPFDPADSIAERKRIISAFNRIDSVSRVIKNGDLITRTGNDFTSESLRSLNRRNKTYSHCGIASIENDTVFIYHALGGEFNPDQKLIREPLKYFSEPYSNKRLGVFRYNLPPGKVLLLLSIIQDYFKMGIMFDLDFNLETDDRMYCAEFVYKSLTKAGLTSVSRSHIGKFEFVGVDDLFLHPSCSKVTELIYK